MLKAIDYAPKILAAMLIVLVFHYTYIITRKPLHALLRTAGLEESLNRILIDNIYRFTLLFVGIVMAAGQLGINVGAALAGIGIAGIAIGFAAQDVLASIIAGFMIFFDKPFRVGDWIQVDGNYGAVTEITLRSTRIRTLNNTYVVIPNKIIVDSVVNNHSKNGETRIEVPIGIAYKESIPAARSALLEAVETVEGVDQSLEPSVVVDMLDSSSVNLTVRVWIHEPAKERQIFFDTLEACKLALDDAGIEIPFPHLQMFVEDVRPAAAKALTGSAK